MWEQGVREGNGQQSYISSADSIGDTYEGNWVQDNRFELCACIACCLYSHGTCTVPGTQMLIALLFLV